MRKIRRDLILEAYSRLKDTSLLPRGPNAMGHKATDTEKAHSFKRIVGGRTISYADQDRKDRLAAKGSEKKVVDTLRLSKNINKGDMHDQRQFHRNRKAQVVLKVLENVLEAWHNEKGVLRRKSTADRKARIVAEPAYDDEGRLVMKRQKRSNVRSYISWDSTPDTPNAPVQQKKH